MESPPPANDGEEDRRSQIPSKLPAKGKSCKGYLYYSSFLDAKSHNPRCVGISRTLQQVPDYIVKETASELEEDGSQLGEFRYSCIGYSVYIDKKGASGNQSDKKPELPFCVGMEILMNKRLTEAANGLPVHARRTADGQSLPQPRIQKPAPAPTPSARDEFLTRFQRSAGLVASGVIKNANKVCNHIKSTIDDIIYPYRRK